MLPRKHIPFKLFVSNGLNLRLLQRGVVTSRAGQHESKTVYDALRSSGVQIVEGGELLDDISDWHCVGRLDKETSGCDDPTDSSHTHTPVFVFNTFVHVNHRSDCHDRRDHISTTFMTLFIINQTFIWVSNNPLTMGVAGCCC